MAVNRFKKSIESVEKEHEIIDELDNIKIEEVLEEIDSNILANTKDNILINVLDNIKTNTTDNILVNISSNTIDNILTNIKPEEAKGKNITFYLSSEVDIAINNVAKQKKISKSKLVDSILKQVLLGE